MKIIEQKIVVQEWPLKKAGDKKFFGYVLAVGVCPDDWDTTGMFIYADFGFPGRYARYRLPNDFSLIKDLLNFLCLNFKTARDINEIYGKVWIERTDKGYQTE